MIKLILNTLLFSFILISCNSQVKQNEQVKNLDTIQPKVDIKVQKKYDKEGNLISIDSTYSYFYSNIHKDSIQEKLIFDKFMFEFNNQYKSLDSIFMSDFFSDTPFKIKDFYTDDFFQQNFKFHQKRIERTFKEMDSLKNSFYNNQNEIFKNNVPTDLQ